MMRTFFLACAFVFTGSFFSVSFASAQTLPAADLQALVKQLQEQIQALQVQVQELKTQLVAAQQESAAVKQEVAATKQEVAEVKQELQLTRSLQRGAKGDDVKKLQEFLTQFPDVYPVGLVTGFYGPATETAVKKLQAKHGIEQLGIIGPKTLFKINELISEGAGRSGVIPPGLLRASGIERSAAGTTTLPVAVPPPTFPGAAGVPSATAASSSSPTIIATTSPAALCAADAKYCATREACVGGGFHWYTVSCHKAPPPAFSCAASYNYCVGPTECSTQGWYACRGSCYPSLDACQGESYVPPAAPAPIPAVPAMPAQPAAPIGITPATAPATTTATTTMPIPTSTPSGGLALPDLRVAGNEQRGGYTAGTPGVFKTTLYNGGSGIASGNPTIEVEAVVGGKIFRPGSSEYTRTCPSMPAGTECTVEFTLTFSNADIGNKEVRINVDPLNKIAESNEANNLDPGAGYSTIQPIPVSGTCTGLTLITGKTQAVQETTAFAPGDVLMYRYTCIPLGTSFSGVTVQLVSASGAVMYSTTGFSYPATIVESGLLLSYFGIGAGNYTLRACFSSSCASPAATVTVTVGTGVDSSPPALSIIQASFVTATSAVVTWMTDEASDSQVDYGLTTGYGSQTSLDANRVTSHSIALSGLSASTAYHYRVKSKDAAGNPATSADQTFTTAVSATSCVGPYHVFAPDGRCVWSCGTGTTPDNVSNQCVCQSGYIESGTDQFGRRICIQTTTTATTTATTTSNVNFDTSSRLAQIRESLSRIRAALDALRGY